jgi:hypothetical protein
VLILVLSNNGICITILPACVCAIVIVLSPPKTFQFLKSHQQGKNPWAHMSWSYMCLHVVDGHWRNSSCTLGYSCTWWGDVKTLCKPTSGTHVVLTAILFIYICFFSCSKHRHEKSHLVTQNTNHHAQFHKTLVTKQNNDSENTCTWWGDVKTLSKLTFCSSGRIVFCFFSCSKCRHEKSVFVTQNSIPPCTISQNPSDKAKQWFGKFLHMMRGCENLVKADILVHIFFWQKIYFLFFLLKAHTQEICLCNPELKPIMHNFTKPSWQSKLISDMVMAAMRRGLKKKIQMWFRWKWGPWTW